MKKIILLLSVFTLITSCSKEKADKEKDHVKKQAYVKFAKDSIEFYRPKTWKVVNDERYLFGALMDKSDEKSEAILLSNSTDLISLKDYIIESAGVAGELQQKEGLPYYIYKYYLGNNDYCYIFETFPKQKKGVYSFIREYNGNIYDFTFKTPEGLEQIPFKKDSLLDIVKTLKINNQYMFPKDSKPVVTDIAEL